MDVGSLIETGAAYAALQLVAQLVMLIAPKHTIAFRAAKYLVAGRARS